MNNYEQLDVEARHSLNAQKKAAEFRTEQETGIDVEYRKIRLERVILAGCFSSAKMSEIEANLALDELEHLAETAGADVLARILQQRTEPDKSTYLGKGKANEIAALIDELEADTLVVNDTLLPSVSRRLEEIVKVKVVDRTALILDIFAKHAKSKTGRIQIELAQLEYLLPRLRGWGAMMSRQTGGQVGGGVGIGSRGPGETQLEVDRRRIRTKITLLKRKLAKVRKEDETRRHKRLNNRIPSVAIVGYTNAGKSSLLNALTNSNALVENALFATLDTTTRSMEHPKFTITDTVGFIQNLPTALVEAFYSTLKEAAETDIILRLADASSPQVKQQIEAVNAVLAKIRSLDNDGKVVLKTHENEIVVFNKIDLLTNNELERLKRLYKDAVFISVAQNRGLDKLLDVICQKVFKINNYKDLDIVIPFEDGRKLAMLYQHGEVVSRTKTESGTRIIAKVPETFQLN
ncbi:MAG: GTPase HflX [Candidatus Ancillula sp.]|jgi:GTP-binding protein HflX|nr:GTPase HflX [Candidatus Ancillula sp.]